MILMTSALARAGGGRGIHTGAPAFAHEGVRVRLGARGVCAREMGGYRLWARATPGVSEELFIVAPQRG